MFKYAQLNENDVVVAVSYLASEVELDNMILVPEEVDVKLKSLYDRKTDKFIAPEVAFEREATIQEQILFETKYQTMLLEMGGF